MNTTPRPWECEPAGPSDIYGPGDDVETVAYVSSEGCRADNARLIVRAVNAFDALLAVAKAADDPLITETHPRCRLCQGLAGHRPSCALVALNAAHPDWREWTP